MLLTKEHINEFLRSPYKNLLNPYKSMTATTLIVVVSLYILKPWGWMFSWQQDLIFALICGALSALSECIHRWILPALFPRWYDKKHWTYGKQFLSTIFLLATIAVFVYSFFVIAFKMPTTPKVLFYFITIFLIIFPLPLGLTLMWQRNNLLSQNLKMANELNEKLLERIGHDSDGMGKNEDITGENISIGDGKNSVFAIPMSQFLFAEANGNYVKFAFRNNGELEKKTIRTTMKSIEEACFEHKNIVRCHRAYIVNTNYIKMVTGNAQECLLHLDGCNNSIPVSRSLRAAILERIK